MDGKAWRKGQKVQVLLSRVYHLPIHWIFVLFCLCLLDTTSMAHWIDYWRNSVQANHSNSFVSCGSIALSYGWIDIRFTMALIVSTRNSRSKLIWMKNYHELKWYKKINFFQTTIVFLKKNKKQVEKSTDITLWQIWT